MGCVQSEVKDKSLQNQNSKVIQKISENINDQNHINEEKQLRNQSKQAINQLRQAFQRINQQLPHDIQKLYLQAKSQGIFIDKQFQANNNSFGDSTQSRFTLFATDTVWLRPKEFVGNNFKVFDGIFPSDIQQGNLHVCYLLATLSTLAQNPSRIHKIFIFQNTQLGFYVLKFFIHGKPKYVTLDDLIPCNKNSKIPIFSKPIGNKIWVLLIEKAWAKCFGDFLSPQRMTPQHVMQNITSAPSYNQFFNKQNKPNTQLIKQIVKHIQNNQIVAINTDLIKKQGLTPDHVYSILKVYKINDKYLFKIRNPQNHSQWNGQYGCKSKLWTSQFKKITKYKDTQLDKGIFFMTQNQLVNKFQYYSACQIIQTNIYSFEEFTSKKNQDLFYKFKVAKAGKINIRVIQLFDRILKDKTYKYSSVAFEIGKILQNNNIKFIAQGNILSFAGAKQVQAFQQIYEKLQIGQYFVRIRVQWQNQKKYNVGILAGYGPQKIIFQRLPKEQGIKFMKSLFFSQSQNVQRIPLRDGFFKIGIMKAQIILIGETQKQGKYKISFKLNKERMQFTETDYGKISDTEVALTFTKDQPGIGTAMKTDISKAGGTGTMDDIVIQKI